MALTWAEEHLRDRRWGAHAKALQIWASYAPHMQEPPPPPEPPED